MTTETKSVAELAADLGLSASACHRRVQRLETEGYVRDYVALLDARKGIDMFNQLKTPILGMIENMSTHICSNCGHEEHVFGHGGVAAEAEKLGVPLLAEIPLHLDIRVAADGGAPIVVSKPDSTQAEGFRKVAKALIAGGHA